MILPKRFHRYWLPLVSVSITGLSYYILEIGLAALLMFNIGYLLFTTGFVTGYVFIYGTFENEWMNAHRRVAGSNLHIYLVKKATISNSITVLQD